MSQLPCRMGRRSSINASILQPAYLPWVGYFDLLLRSDHFILLDDVQFTYRDWRTRNRIRTDTGWSWLTVPVLKEGPHRLSKIKDIQIDHQQPWVRKHLQTIRQYYSRSPYFDEVYVLLETILQKKQCYLSDLNAQILFAICEYLGINTKISLASNLNVDIELEKSQRLIALLKSIKASHYISGNAAKDYIRIDDFEREGLSVEWQDYDHPYYLQSLWKDQLFYSHMSIIDLLFYYGKESRSVLTKDMIKKRPETIEVIVP
jgi:hypothetical protein